MPTMRKKLAKATYSFAVDGGVATTITPAITETVPKGAIVTNIITNERTALTSGGSATVVVKVGATALTDALAFDTAFTATGNTHALASSAEAIPIGTAGSIVITVATAALTAGVLDIYVEYIEA